MILHGCQAKPRTPTIIEKICPQCGHEIEMFSIDTQMPCEHCGFVAYNDTLSCVQWCAHAKDCVGEEMYELMTKTDGIYGGRFSGAGFKGCCMALIDPAYRESVTESISREYLKQFPELEGKYSVHICQSADGVKERV